MHSAFARVPDPLNLSIHSAAAAILCITKTEYELSEVHSRLVAQNDSLHSLLESHDMSHDQSHERTRDKDTPTASSNKWEEVLESKLTFEQYH